MEISPISSLDLYKSMHHEMYPDNTVLTYSNLTARKSIIPNVDYCIFFGLQYFIKDFLLDKFNTEFFFKDKSKVINAHKRLISHSLSQDYDCKHLSELWDLGYLPIEIKALPEGDIIPIGVPCLTIFNTHPKFFWLTNYLETVLSTYIWHPITVATITRYMRTILNRYARETNPEAIDFTKFQLCNFSMRGCSGLESGAVVDGAHLTGSYSSDTVPGIIFVEKYYNANLDKEIISKSAIASEHAPTCVSALDTSEFDFYERMIDKFPNGILSLVSDSFSLWEVITNYLPRLKEKIMKRNGTLTIRPDSGNPVDIICGNIDGKTEEEKKGVIQLLYEVIGGTVSSTGYKVLDPHIFCLQGDGINLERLQQILECLKRKSFASTNLCFGTGSYNFVRRTRDDLGQAIKMVYSEKSDKQINVFKDPITDSDKFKKSACGLLQVKKEHGKYVLYDQVDWTHEQDSELKTVFKNGQLLCETSLSEIRSRVESSL